MNNLTFSSHYARAVVSGLDRKVADSEGLLRLRNIDPDLIREPRARVPIDQFSDDLSFDLTWTAKKRSSV